MLIHRKEVFVFSCAFWFQVTLSIFTSSAPERSRGSRDKIRSTSRRIITMHPVYSTFLLPQLSTFNFQLSSSLRVGWCPAPVGSIPPSISSASWPLSCRPGRLPSLSLLRIGWVPRNAHAPDVVALYNHHVATFTL